MVVRGGVYWANLDTRRPCVVVSASSVLAVPVWQTHVVPLTYNVDRAALAGNVLLPGHVTGLPRASVAIPLGLELIDPEQVQVGVSGPTHDVGGGVIRNLCRVRAEWALGRAHEEERLTIDPEAIVLC